MSDEQTVETRPALIFPTREDRGTAWVRRREYFADDYFFLGASALFPEDRWEAAPTPTPVFDLGRCVFEDARLRIGEHCWVEITPWDFPGVTTSAGVAPSRRRRTIGAVMNWLSRRDGNETTQLTLPLSGRNARALESDRALAAFERAIPAAVGNSVCRFRESRWEMLRFAALGSAATELLDSNPGMAFALAHHRTGFEPGSQEWKAEIRRLLAMKRRVALGRMGWMESDRVEKILRKVVPQTLGPVSIACLRRAVQHDEIARRLSGLPSLPRAVLEIARFPNVARHLSSKVWHMAADGTELRVEEMIEADLSWTEGLTLRDGAHAIERLKLARTTGDVFYWSWRRRVRFHNAMRLPAAPFAGSESIQPIRTARELVVEGKEQDNCCATLIRDAASGMKAVYRVFAPERATLALARSKTGDGETEWKIEELRAARNEPVADETCKVVEAWFAAAKGAVLQGAGSV